MATIVKPIAVAACLLLLGLAGCSGSGPAQDEMSWARTALARNEHLEVVAADPQAKTFTVRVKDSGKLLVIPLDQIVAGPQGRAGGPQETAGALQGASASQGSAEATPPSLAESQGAARGPGPALASGESPAPAAPVEAPAPGGESSEGPAGPRNNGLASIGEPAQSPGNGVADDSGAPEAGGTAPPAPPGPRAQSAANAREGSVLASGPGYSIKASGPRSAPTHASLVTTARGTPVERLHDPIVCQGARLLHIDNRNLEFDGDAVSAEDGCEIHITNTHIIAKGVGVLARAANVHIENSEIEGDSGAIDASDGAQVYAGSSHFKGLTRRLESSAFHDLGGNVWN